MSPLGAGDPEPPFSRGAEPTGTFARMTTCVLQSRVFATLGALAAAAAIWAPSAQAAKPATGVQLSAITKAVHSSTVGGMGTVPRSHYTVTKAKISTVSSSWATASITPTKAYQSTMQGAYAFFVQPAGTKSWVLVDLGTAEVGCGFAPNPVINDLVDKGASSACTAS